MGFSIVISSAILFLSFFTYIAVIFPMMDNMHKTNNALISSMRTHDDINRTSIKINDIIVNDTDRSIVRLTIENDGKNKLLNYTYFDLIITYDANINGSMMKVTEYLRYGSTLAEGYWTMDIQNDILDPNILNPNEEAQVNVKLSNNIADNATIVAIMGTDNGVTATMVKVI